MKRFEVTSIHDADCVVGDGSRIGELYHVARNKSGGAIMTPIGRYFAWRPQFIEGYFAYWRVDCFVRQHNLAPDAKLLGEALIDTLIKEGYAKSQFGYLFTRAMKSAEGSTVRYLNTTDRSNSNLHHHRPIRQLAACPRSIYHKPFGFISLLSFT
jgi:hypothetical protein